MRFTYKSLLSLGILCFTAYSTASQEDSSETTGLTHLSRHVHPPGLFVGMGTHRIHYRCVGTAAPTVVIDTGIGGAAIEWLPIQDALAAGVRVCTYDRAGYGWSDPGPGPRTTPHIAGELLRLLDLAGERGPYVFVGHSFGGFNVRFIAARYPRDVAALVLIESSHPRQLLGTGRERPARRNAINATRIGVNQRDVRPHVAVAGFLNSRRKAIFAQMDELAHFEQSARDVQQAGAIEDIPLVVIARAITTHHPEPRERDWRRLQRGLSKLSPLGRFVVSGTPEHDVHLADPELIVREILGVVDEARRRGP